jgi:hypothetical protein
MKYSRNRKINKKRKTTNKKYKKTGGGCGCGTKLYGGSSGPSNFTQLSPATYYPYYSVAQDPNNSIVSTSTPSTIHGGSKKKRSKKHKKTKHNKIYKQKGGVSVQDITSIVPPMSVNNISSSITGSNTISNPSFLENNLSVNQPSTYLPNTPYVPPGMSFFV